MKTTFFAAGISLKDTPIETPIAELMVDLSTRWGDDTDFIDHDDHLMLSHNPKERYSDSSSLILGHGSYHSAQGTKALEAIRGQLLGLKNSTKLCRKSNLMAIGITTNGNYLFNSRKGEAMYVVLFPDGELVTNDGLFVRMLQDHMEAHIVGIRKINPRTLLRLHNGVTRTMNKA